MSQDKPSLATKGFKSTRYFNKKWFCSFQVSSVKSFRSSHNIFIACVDSKVTLFLAHH
jgi:hypothetical protein